MGKGGPSKTPKEVLKMTGGWRGEYRGDEPKAESANSSMRCPARIKGEARRVWRRIVKQMAIMGILTYADENLLALYCRTWARWDRADTFVEENGEGWPVMKDGKVVSVHKYPQTVVATQLLASLVSMGDRLGLSPGARASLAIEGKGKVQGESPEKAAFFTRAG